MSAEVAADHSDAVEVLNPQGRGAALILCEHASNAIPDRYQGLGLSAKAAQSHAAWDPGARAMAVVIARQLDAPMVASRISRLAYDCNRPPASDTAIPERSEVFEVPGNRGLSEAARQERIDSIYTPFCNTVSAVLEARRAAGLETVLITVHSFTPVYFGVRREVEIGILNDEDARMADAMLAEAGRVNHRNIRRNEPYGPEDGVTHSLKLHGMTHGLPNVMLEIRNDLLKSPDEEVAMAEELLALIRPALAKLVPCMNGDAHA